MSDKRQETIADIIASKRLRAAEMEKTLGDQHSFVESLKDDADRIEAAWRREKSVIEADALSAGGLVEAMRQKEAICTKCRDGEPPKNCRFFGEPDGCSSPTYGHYPQLPIGDCAKLREFARLVSHMNDDGYWNGSASICALVDKAKAALAEPPRNCEVGTAKEQMARYNSFCHDHHSYGTGCGGCPLCGEPCCELAWAQMPYKAEGGVR